MDAAVAKTEGHKRKRGRPALSSKITRPETIVSDISDEETLNQNDDENRKPCIGMEFKSEEDAKNLYDEYARRVGFSTHVGQFSRAKPDGPISNWDFTCSKEVYKRKNVESCDAMLRIERKDQDHWVVTKFIEGHSHSIISPSKVHHLRPRRHFAGATKDVADTVGTPTNVNVNSISNDTNHVVETNLIPSCAVETNLIPNRAVETNLIPNRAVETNLIPNRAVETNLIPNRAVETNLIPNRAVETNLIPNRAVETNLIPNRAVETNLIPNRSVETNLIPNCAVETNLNAGPVNYVQQPCVRKRNLGRDAQNLLAYFKKMQAQSPGFYYAVQLDNENRMTNAFWADARSRTAYSNFGDAVVFDTMYRPNQFIVPFAPFTGVNHHGQVVLFGCALLYDESESSFNWLFRTWLSAMNECPPISLTTDQDRAIKTAVSQVLPNTRHCICRWHILKEGNERLAHVNLAHPSFYKDLYNCINYSEAIEDFEQSWNTLIDRYDLHKVEWLQAVYIAREQWAPVYFRGTFFASLSSNQGVSSFLDGYVNQQTTIPVFFKQYERALESSLEKEIEADYDTICTTPVLKTPSPMEQQAANLYTKTIFTKFQEELVETFVYTANNIENDGDVSTFRVAKYEHDHKAFIVMLNMSEMKAKCSCQMFEYSGILCKHILTVFTVTNVLTLPPHYILKRWTQNAKVGAESEDTLVKNMESLTSRFNNICREAIKYSEEGAIAADTYNVAMSVLREGAKKIADVKKNVAKVTPSSQSRGSTQEDNSKKPNVPTVDMGPPSWPWQDMLPLGFNLNDTGVSETSMPHIPITRDGGPTENTVVLTCFKSMTWAFENKNSASTSKVAVLNLKMHDYSMTPPGEKEVQFRLTRITLEPMLKSMAYISQQLSASANTVAVINLKLQDTKTTSGEAEVKFQVSRDTLGFMLRSMVYIREQL